MKRGRRTKALSKKIRLRQEAAAWRDSQANTWREERSAAAWKLFFALPEVAAAQTIMLYASFRSELCTTAAMRHVLAINKRLVLPRVVPNSRLLQACLVSSLDQLQHGAYGILEPAADTPILEVSDIDIVAVPGLAFDPAGYRLGYGAGYYDRFLPALPKDALALGICFAGQMVTRVPRQATDVRLLCIVTDESVIRQPRYMAPDRNYECYMIDQNLHETQRVVTALPKEAPVIILPNISDQAALEMFIHQQLAIKQVAADDCLLISDDQGIAIAAGLAAGTETLLFAETCSLEQPPHFVLNAWKERV